MGVITDAITKLIADSIRDHGLVLWFDPERHYESIARRLNAGQDRVVAFQGSFYQLRREVEPFVRGLDPPKLLLYLPVAWDEAREPLAELLPLGVELRPGAAGNRNTRLAVVARKALKGRVAEERLADLNRQIEQGRLTLEELETWAEEAGGPLPTTLTVLFGTPSVDEAALDFLGNTEQDEEIGKRNALADWACSLSAVFGVPEAAGGSAAELRLALARQALTSELLEALGEQVPEALARLVSQGDPNARKRAAELARAWRNRRGLSSSYRKLATDVERSLHLDSMDLTDAALERIEVFPGLERRLLRRVAARACEDPTVADVAESRQRGFWAEQDSELQAEWTLVAQAGRLLQRAAKIDAELRARPLTWAEVVNNYTGAANWAELDTLQRQLERLASSLEYALANPAPEVEQLVRLARQRYGEVAGALADRFLRAWREAGFSTPGHARQSEVFDRFVAPELAAKRRTAYILVDGLRWELARELPETLGEAFETGVELVVGTAPGITEVGMAALLPSAASGLELGGSAKLEVRLHGKLLRNRADRIAYLKEKAGVPVVDLRLEDAKAFRRRLKELGDGPALVVITSREIDQIGEEELSNAREHMERVLTHLSLAMRRLAEHGFERFVIATDHGYLFGEDLDESEKIDPPGGEALLCHRRVWIGRGGRSGGECLLTEVNRFGAASDLLLAVPWNLAAFRAAGPTAYFHGGLSPQEVLLPVITATPKALATGRGARRLVWEIALGSAKITARFLSVRIQARSGGLFEETWPVVRVEVRAGSEVCAIPVSATYGFQEATGAVALRSSGANAAETEVNTVALMLTNNAPAHGEVSIHVVDTATGVDLKKLEGVEVSLAI